MRTEGATLEDHIRVMSQPAVSDLALTAEFLSDPPEALRMLPFILRLQPAAKRRFWPRTILSSQIQPFAAFLGHEPRHWFPLSKRHGMLRIRKNVIPGAISIPSCTSTFPLEIAQLARPTNVKCDADRFICSEIWWYNADNAYETASSGPALLDKRRGIGKDKRKIQHACSFTTLLWCVNQHQVSVISIPSATVNFNDALNLVTMVQEVWV
ncbi:hypothetical protein C8R47DRAFT_1327167 [Mycena vitilis]|nr:hypothetical protein C8R47DRAFT_1327167 [Mycena vitilis]